MLKNPPQEREWASWLFVGLWTLIIFMTIPFARAIQKFVYLQWGRDTFAYVVIGVVVAACAALLLIALLFDLYITPFGGLPHSNLLGLLS